MRLVFRNLLGIVAFAILIFSSVAHGAECSSVFSDATGVNENLPANTRLSFNANNWEAPEAWPASGTVLSSDDYYFKNATLPDDYELYIASAATVRIFVNGNLSIGKDSLINSDGAAGQLLLLVNGTGELQNDASFTGLFYATGEINLRNKSSVEGVAASQGQVKFTGNSTFTNDQDAVNPDLLQGLCETPGSGTMPAIDTFESYSPGSIDGLAGGTGWGGPWSGQAGQTLVDTSTDPLLFQADNGLSIRSLTTLEVSDNNDRMVVRPLDGTFSGDSLYMSMLVRFQGTPGNNDFLAFWVQSPGFGDSPQFGVKVNEGGGGTDDFFVRLDTNANYSSDLVPGQTYLLVAQFEKDGAGYFNRGRLWVDPQCTDAPPSATSALVNNNPSSQVTEISEIGLRSFNLSSEKQIQVGQVAAGEQWTDVVQCQCLQNGLEATFYNNYNRNDPFPSDPDLTRLDSQVNFNWGNGSPDPAIDNNNFAVQWQGSIEVPETGDYRFRTRTDDGVRLWIDGVQVIDDWRDHAAQNNTTGDIALEKGVRYSIRMQFYENGGQASAVLSWLRPGAGGYEVIPAEALFACLPVASPQLVSGVAECGAASLITLEFAQTDRTRELASSLANNPANYQVQSLANGTEIDVQAATLDESGYRVQLDLATALDEETYEITVSNLRDTGGLEMSPNPDSVEVSAQTTGLTATYWNNRFLDGMPVISRNEANINNNWGNGSPIPGVINNNLFSVRWTGYIRAPESGSYRFRTRTDDGVRLWVNDMSAPIIDRWVNQAATNHTSGTIVLEEGEFYEIRMEMYENFGQAVAQLLWETPGAGGFGIVPGSALFNCPGVTAALDHFRISHGGSAVTCQPSPVTIEAMDADGVPVADYDGTVSLSTSTGNGDWLDAGASAGTLTRGPANSGLASYNFVPADGGVITLNLSHTLAQLVNVDVDDAGIGESPGFDPDIDFRETGFIFHQGADLTSPIPQQIAGRPSNTAPGAQDLRLSAVRTNDDTGACEAFLTGPQTVEMGYVCDSPGGCGLTDAVTVNGSTVASNNSGGMANSSPVTFDFGDDTETSAPLSLTHADAGRISLFVQLALEDAEDSPTGGMLTGASNLFVSVPTGFCIEAIDPASECTGDPAQCSVFTSAGSDFDVRYRAAAWQTDGESGTDFCTGNSTTPGFERSGLELTHQVLAPSSGEAGDLGLEQVSFGTAEQGNTTIAQSLSEVGVFELQLVPGQAWLGTTLPGGNSAPVGRLTPASFNVQVTDPGALAPACEVSAVSDGFLYSGQSTGWGIEPELLITALNTLGDTTTNYTRGDFLKLIAGDVLRDMPEEDSSQVDADGADLLPVVFAEQVGALSAVVGEPGELIYRFSPGDAFSYSKSGLSLVAPFGPELNFGIVQVVDSDSVAANIGLPIEFTPEADFELRYGRLTPSNVYGPETIAELQMPFQAEYWNGDRFVLNTDDGCWAWDTADVANADTTTTNHYSLQANTGTLVDGQGTLVLEPGGSRGEDTLGWIVPVWLQHFWTQGGGLENPSALATFGVFRGHDRVIYWQER